MKKQKWVSGLLIGVLLLLAACSNGKSEQSGSAGVSSDTASKENVTIRMAWWGGQARHDMMNALLDKFEEKYPNIKVEREFGTENQFVEKINTQAAGGNTPDVVQTSSFFLHDFVARKIHMDLDPLVASGDLYISNFSDADLNGGKVDGKLYMISFGHNITGVIYNTAIFEKAGVALPKNNWTWDEYFQTAQELQKYLGKDAWASEDEGGTYRGFDMFLMQRGKSMFNGNDLGFEKQDLVDWLAFWDKMRKAGVVPPAAIQAEQGDKPQEQSMLARGKVAMVSKSSNQLKIFQKSTKDNLGIVSYPLSPSGDQVFPLIIAGAGISPNSKHPKEAAKLLNFIVNEGDAATIFRGEHGPQASKKMQDVIMGSLGEPEKIEYAFVDEMLPSTKPYPAMPAGSTSVQKLVLTENQAVAFGKKTIEQAADDFIAQAQQILKR
ncbi:sugar ABC transporter substrate-binding protein [Cohnella pontilimi]|uniref:Sugar ABC transporter substrate-binding protein n=1 Tax=Cohnella pontilimi TaxID=2564100 RepID=A0A4U0FDN4_9BACL|nr:sugar ABC transporter substrate-binding protein [Cohnella pontilimi]TJY42897.1 sugar ABC transporter substrate-binding protein [Cohnella pontilimi]